MNHERSEPRLPLATDRENGALAEMVRDSRLRSSIASAATAV